MWAKFLNTWAVTPQKMNNILITSFIIFVEQQPTKFTIGMFADIKTYFVGEASENVNNSSLGDKCLFLAHPIRKHRTEEKCIFYKVTLFHLMAGNSFPSVKSLKHSARIEDVNKSSIDRFWRKLNLQMIQQNCLDQIIA